MKKSIIVITAVIAVVMLSVLALTACAPNDKPTKAKENLDKNGYSIITIPGVEYLADGALTGFYAVKSEDDKDTEGIVVIYFEDSSKAKAAFETIKEKINKLKNYVGVDEDEESRWTLKQSGRTIWYGTSAGVKAAS